MPQRLRHRALFTALALAGCASSSSDSGTGLHVSSLWSGGELDQLEYVVMTGDGAPVHASERRPVSPQGLLGSGVDVVIMLPGRLARQKVRCRVNGYRGGALVQNGEADVDVPADGLLEVKITLAPIRPNQDGGPKLDGAAPDAGADVRVDGAGDSGGRDSAGNGPRDNGQGCTGPAECVSGHCSEGVCCDGDCAGACQSCSIVGRVGTCSPVPAGGKDARCLTQPATSCGFDGTCGNGACHKYPMGTACAAGTCTGNMVTGASSCDGNGACVPIPSQSCGAFACDQITRSCKTRCTTGADCASPNTCSAAGACGGFKPLGQPCMGAGECASGNCVDGACCTAIRCNTCYTCNLAGFAGVCRPVPSQAAEPHGACPVQAVLTCGLNGTCNGAGACASYPDGTQCRMARICLNGACR